MADRDRLIACAQMIVSMLEEAKLWDDIYIAIAAHLTLREIFSTLLERTLITEDEAYELGIHPDSIRPPAPEWSERSPPNNVFPLRRT